MKKIIKENLLSIKIIVILIFLDLITKISAYLFLPFEDEVKITDSFSFFLSLNEIGFGTKWKELFITQPMVGILTSLGYVTLGISVIILNKLKMKFLTKLIIFIFLYIILSVLAIGLSQFISFEFNNPILLSIIIRTTICFLSLTLLIYSKSKYFKTAICFWFASILGNLLSFIYPPFGIIDFMYSDLINKLLGLGIFNIADLYPYPFFLMIILSPIYFYFIKRKMKEKNIITSKAAT